jgi:DNA-binding NarL/FixJ family response regulator
MIGREQVDIVIADDHELVRAALAAHLTSEGRARCVGEAGTAAEAIDLIVARAPQVAFVDVGLPDADGFDVVRAVVAAGVRTRVVLVSSRISAALVQQGFDAGAWGYLSKVSSVELLPHALESVVGGVRYVDPEVAGDLRLPAADLLDPTELRVLEHLAEGREDEAIARQLRLDLAAVATHVDSLLGKLGCATRAEAVGHAIREGFAE